MWIRLVRKMYLAARRVLLGTGLSLIPPFSWIKMTVVRHLRGAERVPVLGSWMRRDPSDCLNLAVNGVYEPLDTAFAENVVKTGDTVVDVGANIGYYTCYFARLVGPTGHVLAFEPARDTMEILCDNVRYNGYSHVVLENQAVTEKSGPLTLYIKEGNPGDNRIFKDDVESVPRPEQAAEGVCLDDVAFLREHKPSFIKMDIQGAEILAIRGMRRVLKESPDVCVLLEYWPYGLIRLGFRPEALVEDLLGMGLKVCRVTDEGKLVPVDPAQLKNLCGVGVGIYINLVAAHPARMAALMAERTLTA